MHSDSRVQTTIYFTPIFMVPSVFLITGREKPSLLALQGTVLGKALSRCPCSVRALYPES